MLERADSTRARMRNGKRRITVRGKLLGQLDTDPLVIARSMRKQSELSRREALLDAAEAKARGR